MSSLEAATHAVRAGQELTADEIREVVVALASAEVAEAPKADLLSALADRGETAAEIAAFAREFRARAVDPGVERWAPHAIDIVGTGGDHAGGFNISSMVVLVLASAGLTVMKHGNRGITSKCGSADLLKALGVDLEASPLKLRQALDALGYCFFFAPAYHPTFKHIAPVRKTLAVQGRRSVFNILGPLINPGRPAHVLLGVFSERWVDMLAQVLELLGTQAGLAAHGILEETRGIDELTTATPNRVRGIGRLRAIDTIWRGEEFGFAPGTFADLQGGDVDANLLIVKALLAGTAPRSLVDTIVFNAAAALWISGKVPTIQEGAVIAREIVEGGALERKIAATRDFYLS